MKFLGPAIATCASAVLVSTLGVTSPAAAAASPAVTPDVESIALNSVNESGLDQPGATDASAGGESADASGVSFLPTVFASDSRLQKLASGSVGGHAEGLGGDGVTVAGNSLTETEEEPSIGEGETPEESAEPTEPAEPSESEDPDISGSVKQKTEDGVNIAAMSDSLDLPADNPSLVGVVWDGESSAVVQVRTKVDGDWGDWGEIHEEDVPEGSVENGRGGTEPFIIASGSETVQMRVLGESAPENAELVLVDPKYSAADAAQVEANTPVVDPQSATGEGTGVAENASFTAEGTSAAGAEVSTGAYTGAEAATAVGTANVKKVPAPKVGTRKSWGAKESMRRGSPSYSSSIKAAVVHHTTGTNSYSASQVPSILRGIYSFHVNGRGWSDVGYNMLVDKYGRLWEGRAGGIDKRVVGAHTSNYNSNTFGISAMGNFDKTAPSKAMLTAIQHAVAWKLGNEGVSATSKATVNGKRVNAVSGHRDFGQTACPGARLYSQLGSIRSGAGKLQSSGKAPSGGGEEKKKEAPKPAVKTAIQSYYDKSDKSLGKPQGKEYKVTGGVAQKYTKGYVYWSSRTGAVETRGAIGTAHAKQVGTLGLPTVKESGGLKGGGAYQKFQKGSVHWSSKSGAQATSGVLQKYWGSKGYERGHLGYPVSTLSCKDGRCEQTFQGARLVWANGYGTTEYKRDAKLTPGARSLTEEGGAGEPGAAQPSTSPKPSPTKKPSASPKPSATKKPSPKPSATKKPSAAPAPSKKPSGQTAEQKRKIIVAEAKKHVGKTPYVWGGTTTKGWDCSGYTKYVYAKAGINLPRTSGAQMQAGKVISASEAKPGDMIWRPGHIGIISETKGMMYDAGSKRTGTAHRSYSWMVASGAKFIRVV